MRLLFINQTFYPDISATAQQLTDLCRELVARGHQVSVLCDRRDYLNPGHTHPYREQHEGVEVVRVASIDLGGASRLRRILSALMLNVAMAVRLSLMPKADLVIALTSPPLIAAVAAVWARLRGVPFVYWIMDLNPDQAIAAGWVREGSFRARVLRAVLRWTLKSSAKVIVLDRFMAERVQRYGVEAERIAIDPPWPLQEDAVAAVPPSENRFLQAHGLSGSFVVMYSGNHSICHPLDTILEAAQRLAGDPSITFVFIGGGERVRDVQRFREAHQLKNIIQLPYQPREALSHSLSAADLHLVVLGAPFVGIVHPCKIYGVIQVQRPTLFLGPRTSHLGELVTGAEIGEQVEHGDVEGMVEAICRVKAREPGERDALAARLSVLSLERFNRARLIDAVVNDLEGVARAR